MKLTVWGINMNYEIILFDADETLFDFKKSEKDAFKNTILEFGMKYDEKYHFKIYNDINTAIWKEFEEGNITQKKLKTERFKRLSDKLQVRFDEFDFAKAYMKYLSYASYLLENSENLIKNLYNNYKLAIVTNGLTDVQDRRVRKSIIGKYFYDVVISEEAGVKKPDPEIFSLALKSFGNADKSQVLMVGDSLTSDIQGGMNFGIDTCWYNPEKTYNDTGIKPTYEIHNLLDLEKILENQI